MPKVHFDVRCFVAVGNNTTGRYLNAGLNKKALQKKYPLCRIITGHEANLEMGLDDNGYPLVK